MSSESVPADRSARWRAVGLACVALGIAVAAGSRWWPGGTAAPANAPAAGAAAHAGLVPPMPASPLPPQMQGTAPVDATSATPMAGAHEVSPQQIDAMVARLTERLTRQPDDADGWAMLARTHAVSGRHDQAVVAFRKAQALRPDDAVLLADHADALAMTQGRRIAGEPMKLVQRALQLAPDNLKALSLAGTEAFDRGDFAAAVRHWDRLLARGGADSPFARQITEGLAEARRRAAAPARAG